MNTISKELSAGKNDARLATTKSWRRAAWILMLLADVGLLAWGAIAAVAPEHLLGPNSTPILHAEYENFTGYSWSEFSSTSPNAVVFMTLVFRMYGIYGVGFSLMAIAIAVTAFRRGEPWAWWTLLIGNTLTYVSAMIYDQIARAVGPFELTEYLGLGAIYFALATTAPFLAARRTSQYTD
jgi:MFS family permease